MTIDNSHFSLPAVVWLAMLALMDNRGFDPTVRETMLYTPVFTGVIDRDSTRVLGGGWIWRGPKGRLTIF